MSVFQLPVRAARAHSLRRRCSSPADRRKADLRDLVQAKKRISRMPSSAVALAALCWIGLCGPLGAAGPLAIQGAKIITNSGQILEEGTVLIRDGKIAALGSHVDVPGEAKVINAAGKVVMPGFVDAHNSAGMSQPNERNEVVPFLSVIDSIDPVASYFEECRRNGITTAAVVPGNSTLIGGQAAIVKTAGQYVNDMILRREAGLKLSLRPTSGSRMSQMARLRKELDKAKTALEKDEESGSGTDGEDDDNDSDKDGESDGDGDGSDQKSDDADQSKSDAGESGTGVADDGLDAMKQAVQGKLPVYIYCQTAMDVSAALKLVDDYGLKPILVLGQECHKAAKLLAERGETVILDPTLVYWKTDPRTRKDRKIILPKIYGDAGVPYVFQTADSASRTTLGSSYFWFQAATAVKYGMSQADALAALTLGPAQLLGVDSMIGSIEVGKDADLVILTGEPLDISTWVEYTIVDGEVVYDRSQDEKLDRLLSPTAE